MSVHARALALFRRGGGAVVTQFVNAGGSLVLQVLAARTLGASGYGAFTLVNATLVFLTAVQTGWVGDSFTVLDRADKRIRGALAASQAAFAVISFGVAAAVGLALHLVNTRGALLFGLMMALWVTEEALRRVFMARLQFWALTINDSTYVAAALATLAALRLAGVAVSLELFLIAMSAGALAAIALAVVQLPRAELRFGPVTRSGLREVSSFAFWRSAQNGTRPLGILLARVLLAAIAGKAMLGQVEAARLLMAPASLFVQGVSSFLLPLYSGQRGRRRARPAPVLRDTVALTAVTTLLCLLAIGFRAPLAHLLTSGKIPIYLVPVGGWALWSIASAIGIPPAQALIARRRSRDVFVLRSFDTCGGVLFVYLLLLAGAPHWTPVGLGAGVVVGALAVWWRLRVLAAEDDRRSAAPVPAARAAVPALAARGHR